MYICWCFRFLAITTLKPYNAKWILFFPLIWCLQDFWTKQHLLATTDLDASPTRMVQRKESGLMVINININTPLRRPYSLGRLALGGTLRFTLSFANKKNGKNEPFIHFGEYVNETHFSSKLGNKWFYPNWNARKKHSFLEWTSVAPKHQLPKKKTKIRTYPMRSVQKCSWVKKLHNKLLNWSWTYNKFRCIRGLTFLTSD